ncbi:alpha/beta hydrolase [Thermocoleostomius sinensis]|uniref:Alpha/beta hydrolase n=1 Tax=Thermocoleostomius sinensis A174 TaxID=2016057 RepID=A0A9E9CAR2_9CYAN|nr:alpha/beta hydrolase [Thermocoleostomius sinensis]WAL61322.1 alpha/beta hydrolase [Thermocoleostomius sinensis A174]
MSRTRRSPVSHRSSDRSVQPLCPPGIFAQGTVKQSQNGNISTKAGFNFQRLLSRLVSIGILPIILTAGSALGAERITLSYGAVERSIAVKSLAAYAEEGTVSSDLKAYTRFFNDQQLATLRQFLSTRADLSAVAVAQFLYTDQGEMLLERLGNVVRTESNLSGFYAIRSALILAAADETEGLTVLNVLKQFPLSRVRVDLVQTLRIVGDLEELIRQTQDAVALVKEQSAAEAYLTSWIDFSSLPDLRQPGSFPWQRRTLGLYDPQRNRSFPVDIYWPQLNTASEQTPATAAPVIVISHGLGSDRGTYAYLAQHLASYGFVVAVPEHPGSNAQQLRALISGQASQVTEPNEFINRPLDIQFLLNELAELSQTDPTLAGRLNLNQVGIIGQSMGGYTGLALAGAQINVEQLEADCTTDTLNLSLLLQCRALNLPQPLPDLRDPRIKAVLAINPIGSSLLGEADYANIQVPVMIVSGTADTIAPALPEQIRPFTWLQTPERYLLLLQGGTHFSSIDVPDPEASLSQGTLVQLPSEVVGPNPQIAHLYLQSIGLAFLGLHVAGDFTYLPYLEASYARYIAEASLPISLVHVLTPDQLMKAIEEQTIELVLPSTSATLRQRDAETKP